MLSMRKQAVLFGLFIFSFSLQTHLSELQAEDWPSIPWAELCRRFDCEKSVAGRVR